MVSQDNDNMVIDDDECSFCGGDCRSLVTTNEGVSICEICCRNILSFFTLKRKNMVKHWSKEGAYFEGVSFDPENGSDDDDPEGNSNLH